LNDAVQFATSFNIDSSGSTTIRVGIGLRIVIFASLPNGTIRYRRLPPADCSSKVTG
jgi:hypothetical protein